MMRLLTSVRFTKYIRNRLNWKNGSNLRDVLSYFLAYFFWQLPSLHSLAQVNNKNKPFSSVFIVEFEQVNVSWVQSLISNCHYLPKTTTVNDRVSDVARSAH